MSDRAEFLAWRAGGIGASDVPIIVGLAPASWGQSPYTLWLEKTCLVPDDDHENENMEFGRYAELMVAPWFHAKTGLYIAGEQTRCHRPDAPWMQCTLDGFVVEHSGASIADALGGAEIKTTNDAPEAWEAEVPDQYQVQTHWQMAVTGFDRVFLPTIHFAFGRRTFRIHEVKRDQATIDWLIERCTEFWRLVTEGEPPPIDASDATGRALARLYDPADRTGVRFDPETAADVALLAQCKADMDRLERVAVGAQNRIKAAMAEATEGYVGDRLAVTWRQARAVDVAKLTEDHPELCAQYRKLDLSALVKGNRKLAETYKTVPGARRFLLKETS